MSAVENVEARIARLQHSLDAKCTELHALQTRQRYNAALGVDEDLGTGRSVAVLEVKVVAGRNMLYNSGFLSGKTTYVRAWLEPHEAALDGGKRSTKKRGVHYTPCWQESLLFQSVTHVGACLMVEVMQEERIGNDLLVGSLQIPLVQLQDQRLLEKWHALSKDNQVSASELLLSCRFNRSKVREMASTCRERTRCGVLTQSNRMWQLSATELDVELLQNQLRELHTFHERQRQFTHQATPATDRYVPVNHLKGKEVVVQGVMQRARSTRFDAVATFPFQAARKREHVDVLNVPDEAPASDMHRTKRQRTAVNESTPAPVSFTDKLANWLLPSSALSPSVAPQPFGSVPVNQTHGSYPFKQQPVEKRRAKKSVRPKLQRAPSVLQSFEQWLFTEPENAVPN